MRTKYFFAPAILIFVFILCPDCRAACGTNSYSGHYLIPGPGEKGFDARLSAKARRFDRQFHVFNASAMGVGVDVTVPLSWMDKRRLIERFINEDDSWDFGEFSGGLTAYDVIGDWQKTAGLYAGVGIAADVFRYAVLRDQNADCVEIDIARAQLLAGLDAMHLAFTIPGTPGIVARGFLRKDLPVTAWGLKILPLFDESGRPLPLKKDNGEWRSDISGQYSNYIWEDSISRDQLLGWAMASAVASEVMRDDPTFPQAVKDRLRADASAVCTSLRKVRKSGYDLEFPDADGRITLYGYLNENNLDGTYMPGLKNGFYAVMALGIYGALSYAAQDPEAEKYLYKTLIERRKLPSLAAEHMKFVDMGAKSNFSNYNMAFTSAWLAIRYINDNKAQMLLRKALEFQLYNHAGTGPQPTEMKQSLFDLIFASAQPGGTIFSPPIAKPDDSAVVRAIDTLNEFPSAPFWEFTRENCDKKEIETGDCTLDDGTRVHLLGDVGWGDNLVADRPIPMKIRPASNYYWRSNPFTPNGTSSGERMNTGVDFRIAYWLGRWTPVP
jgi:hypothetical protein